MKNFKHPIHMPEPSFTELYSGEIEFYEDIEHYDVKPGQMKSFKVKSGFTNAPVESQIVPVVSVLWKTKRLDGGVKYESKFVAKPNKLATISCDVYGNNSNMLNILYSTGWPKYTWLAHTITYIKIDSVCGSNVKFTCYQVD